MEVVMKKRYAIINRATLLEKGIKIPDPKCVMWT